MNDPQAGKGIMMTASLQVKNNRFHIVIELGNGKQKWISTRLPIAGNKRKAEEMLRATLREYEDKAAAQAAQEAANPKSNILVPELVQEWLTIKRREVRANTYTSYEETALNHIIPYFAGIQAATLTTAQIKQYYNAKFAAGLSPDSLTRHRTILRGMLDYAIETLDLFSVNV
ncbi:MAG TPA: hypothetical protein DEQ14_06915, partial [Treponema sp.]|nr:hypothetical protein [Treponema sp.]